MINEELLNMLSDCEVSLFKKICVLRNSNLSYSDLIKLSEEYTDNVAMQKAIETICLDMSGARNYAKISNNERKHDKLEGRAKQKRMIYKNIKWRDK